MSTEGNPDNPDKEVNESSAVNSHLSNQLQESHTSGSGEAPHDYSTQSDIGVISAELQEDLDNSEVTVSKSARDFIAGLETEMQQNALDAEDLIQRDPTGKSYLKKLARKAFEVATPVAIGVGISQGAETLSGAAGGPLVSAAVGGVTGSISAYMETRNVDVETAEGAKEWYQKVRGRGQKESESLKPERERGGIKSIARTAADAFRAYTSGIKSKVLERGLLGRGGFRVEERRDHINDILEDIGLDAEGADVIDDVSVYEKLRGADADTLRELTKEMQIQSLLSGFVEVGNADQIKRNVTTLVMANAVIIENENADEITETAQATLDDILNEAKADVREILKSTKKVYAVAAASERALKSAAYTTVIATVFEKVASLNINWGDTFVNMSEKAKEVFSGTKVMASGAAKNLEQGVIENASAEVSQAVEAVYENISEIEFIESQNLELQEKLSAYREQLDWLVEQQATTPTESVSDQMQALFGEDYANYMNAGGGTQEMLLPGGRWQRMKIIENIYYELRENSELRTRVQDLVTKVPATNTEEELWRSIMMRAQYTNGEAPGAIERIITEIEAGGDAAGNYGSVGNLEQGLSVSNNISNNWNQVLMWAVENSDQPIANSSEIQMHEQAIKAAENALEAGREQIQTLNEAARASAGNSTEEITRTITETRQGIIAGNTQITRLLQNLENSERELTKTVTSNIRAISETTGNSTLARSAEKTFGDYQMGLDDLIIYTAMMTEVIAPDEEVIYGRNSEKKEVEEEENPDENKEEKKPKEKETKKREEPRQSERAERIAALKAAVVARSLERAAELQEDEADEETTEEKPKEEAEQTEEEQIEYKELLLEMKIKLEDWQKLSPAEQYDAFTQRRREIMVMSPSKYPGGARAHEEILRDMRPVMYSLFVASREYKRNLAREEQDGETSQTPEANSAQEGATTTRLEIPDEVPEQLLVDMGISLNSWNTLSPIERLELFEQKRSFIQKSTTKNTRFSSRESWLNIQNRMRPAGFTLARQAQMYRESLAAQEEAQAENDRRNSESGDASEETPTPEAEATTLTNDEKQILSEMGITLEEWNSLSPQEKLNRYATGGRGMVEATNDEAGRQVVINRLRPFFERLQAEAAAQQESQSAQEPAPEEEDASSSEQEPEEEASETLPRNEFTEEEDPRGVLAALGLSVGAWRTFTQQQREELFRTRIREEIEAIKTRNASGDVTNSDSTRIARLNAMLQSGFLEKYLTTGFIPGEAEPQTQTDASSQETNPETLLDQARRLGISENLWKSLETDEAREQLLAEVRQQRLEQARQAQDNPNGVVDVPPVRDFIQRSFEPGPADPESTVVNLASTVQDEAPTALTAQFDQLLTDLGQNVAAWQALSPLERYTLFSRLQGDVLTRPDDQLPPRLAEMDDEELERFFDVELRRLRQEAGV